MALYYKPTRVSSFQTGPLGQVQGHIGNVEMDNGIPTLGIVFGSDTLENYGKEDNEIGLLPKWLVYSSTCVTLSMQAGLCGI